MRSLELFSGAGGLAKGLEIAGFENLALVEFNRNACETLRKNFDPLKVVEGDVRNCDFSGLGIVDIVAGGPPCQPFSLGGKHQASNDDRDMFPYALKAISDLRPQAFIFENVKGLLRPSFSEYFEYISLRLAYPDFADAGVPDWRGHLAKLRVLSGRGDVPQEYKVHYKLINAADYGIAQTRERVIIVGIRADIEEEWKFPQGEHSMDRLLWEQHVSGEYWQRHGFTTPLRYAHSPYLMHRIEKLKVKYGAFPPAGKPWLTMRDALGHLPEPTSNHGIIDHVLREGAKSYVGHTGSMYDFPSKTVKAGAHGVPGGENMIRFCDESVRYLTIYEAKLIQGFASDFAIHGGWGEAMRQIGNAVPSLVASKLGYSIAALITNSKTRAA